MVGYGGFHTLRRCFCGAIPLTKAGWEVHEAHHRVLEAEWDFSREGSQEPEARPWSRVRRLVLIRDHFACRVCGKGGRRRWRSFRFEAAGVEVHHIIPLKDGGTDHPRNLITLCGLCHRATFRRDYRGVPMLQRRLEAFQAGP